MRYDILTLFPDFFDSPLEQSIIGRAVSKGIIKVNRYNLRDFTVDKHRTTDDTPYGGGCGMVMKVDPVVRALEEISKEGPKAAVILMTPQGAPFNHDMARRFSELERLIIICGRYEGVDERIRDFIDFEVSAGDYVLTGGEIPALVIIDSVGRLIPGVLGEPVSKDHESFTDGLLEYPQYTRPEDFRGLKIPEVLLGGNHAEIKRWRREQSIIRTFERRPDLLKSSPLTDHDRTVLDRLGRERNGRDIKTDFSRKGLIKS